MHIHGPSDLVLLLSVCAVLGQKSTVDSTAPLASPIIVNGSKSYGFAGCYTELNGSDTVRALGYAGQFFIPMYTKNHPVTVPVCLEGCSGVLASNGAGTYNYAALENGSKCYCGHSLSIYSGQVSNSFCNVPCDGDPGTICGGNGFLTLYQLKTLTAPVTGPTGVPPPYSGHRSALSKGGMWAIIALCVALFIFFFWLLYYITKRRSNINRQRLLNPLPPEVGNQSKETNTKMNLKSENPHDQWPGETKNISYDDMSFVTGGLGDVNITSSVAVSKGPSTKRKATLETWKCETPAKEPGQKHGDDYSSKQAVQSLSCVNCPGWRTNNGTEFRDYPDTRITAIGGFATRDFAVFESNETMGKIHVNWSEKS